MRTSNRDQDVMTLLQSSSASYRQTGQRRLYDRYWKRTRKLLREVGLELAVIEEAYLDALTETVVLVEERSRRTDGLESLWELIASELFGIRAVGTAMGQLIWEHHATYWRRMIARTMKGTTEEIEELLQQVCASVWENIMAGKLNEEGKLKAYGASIAHNQSVDFVKERKIKREKYKDWEDIQHALIDRKESWREEEKALMERLNPMLKGFSEKCRYLLMQRSRHLPEEKQMSWEKIAEELKASDPLPKGFSPPIKVDKLKSQWTRCRKDLAKGIAQIDPGLLPILKRYRNKRGRKDNG
ncbi:MAG: sigma-70 family RNA polymerase sigma factor [Bacteroidota bacterium]